MNDLMIINNSKCGYIYLLKLFRDDDITYKIGFASNIDSRISSIKGDRQSDVIPIVYGHVYDKFKVEHYLHTLFADKIENNCFLWNGGECFNFSDNLHNVIHIFKIICGNSLYINYIYNNDCTSNTGSVYRNSSKPLTLNEYHKILDIINKEEEILLNEHKFLGKLTALKERETSILNEYLKIEEVFNLSDNSLFVDLKTKLLIKYKERLDYIKVEEGVIRNGNYEEDIRLYKMLREKRLMMLIAVEFGIHRSDFMNILVGGINFKTHILTYGHTKKFVRQHMILIPEHLEKELKFFIEKYNKQPTDKLFSVSTKTLYNWYIGLLNKAKLESRSFQSLHNTCIKLHREDGWSPERIAQLINSKVETVVLRR